MGLQYPFAIYTRYGNDGVIQFCFHFYRLQKFYETRHLTHIAQRSLKSGLEKLIWGKF